MQTKKNSNKIIQIFQKYIFYIHFQHAIKISPTQTVTICETNCFGLTDPKTWNIYEIKNRPGLILIKNPFTQLGQRYWIGNSLCEYSKFRNNLLPTQFTEEIITNWWCHLQKISKSQKERDKIKSALRWSTLGYHYDWDAKIYNENIKSNFPSDLECLCSNLSSVLGFSQFRSQAAIVNYYPVGTTLAGHTDHSEVDLDAPLFSFSFGQSAVFLIGGKTKEEEPTAIYLRSGDIVVMAKESRLCYHAVPRVFKDKVASWNLKFSEEDFMRSDKFFCDIFDKILLENVKDNHFWQPFEEYLETSRININVRQVLKEGQTSLDS